MATGECLFDPQPGKYFSRDDGRTPSVVLISLTEVSQSLYLGVCGFCLLFFFSPSLQTMLLALLNSWEEFLPALLSPGTSQQSFSAGQVRIGVGQFTLKITGDLWHAPTQLALKTT